MLLLVFKHNLLSDSRLFSDAFAIALMKLKFLLHTFSIFSYFSVPNHAFEAGMFHSVALYLFLLCMYLYVYFTPLYMWVGSFSDIVVDNINFYLEHTLFLAGLCGGAS